MIFPGAGEASTTREYLQAQRMTVLLRELKPSGLGICLGMQLMCRHSEEGDTECLGIFDSDVKKFIPRQQSDKVPQIGWNSVYDFDSSVCGCKLNNNFVYFVHSY